jgi:hypothetical protein
MSAALKYDTSDSLT